MTACGGSWLGCGDCQPWECFTPVSSLLKIDSQSSPSGTGAVLRSHIWIVFRGRVPNRQHSSFGLTSLSSALGNSFYGLRKRVISRSSIHYSLSRGWLISVEAPRHPGHLSSIQLDAVVNYKRTKAMWIASCRNDTAAPLGLTWVNTVNLALGIVFTYNELEQLQENFYNKLKAIRLQIYNCGVVGASSCLAKLQLLNLFCFQK